MGLMGGAGGRPSAAKPCMELPAAVEAQATPYVNLKAMASTAVSEPGSPRSTKRSHRDSTPRAHHGHRAGRLRLHHQDGVGRRQYHNGHICGEDEDPLAGQRDCRFVSSFDLAKTYRLHSLQVSIVSTATTQSALLNHEVYLTEYSTRNSVVSSII